MELLKRKDRTHEIRIRELKSNVSKSFSIKTKESLKTLYRFIKQKLEGKK